MSQPRKIILLGHTGFVGRALGARLAAQGHDVQGFSSASIDLVRPESSVALAAAAPTDATIVLVAAVTPDKGAKVDAFASNVAMATTVARHVEAHGAGRLVYVSSDAVYGERDDVSESSPVELHNPYAVAKFASERILACVTASRAVPNLIVRPTIVFGPDDTHGQYGPNRFVKTVLRERSVNLFGDGEELRDHVFIEDLVEILSRLVAGEQTGVLNLATGESRSFGSIVDALKGIAPFPFEVIRAPRLRPVTHRHFDVQKLRAALPDYVFLPFEESLRKTFLAAQRPAS